MGVFGVIFFGRAKVVAKYRRGAWRGFALGVAIEERSFAALRMTAKGGWGDGGGRRQSRLTKAKGESITGVNGVT